MPNKKKEIEDDDGGMVLVVAVRKANTTWPYCYVL